MEEEAMVEQLSTAEDDTLAEPVEEEKDESESLESILSEEGQPEEETPKEEQASSSEPGWIKKRVEKAVSKAVAETEARMQAMFDEQMAPLRAKMLEDEAKELVRTGAVKDLELAKELVSLRQGHPVQKVEQQQPRNEKGQYASSGDAAVQARIRMLQHQAESIEKKGGPDVRAEFTNNEEIKMKVISGEMDFYDVAEYLKDNKPKKAQAPVRSPNGASGSRPNAIAEMSDAQFKRMEDNISKGARYSLR